MAVTKLKCVAIDDEPLALKLLEQYAVKTPELDMLHTFDDAISGAEFIRQNNIDLLFIDINMPDITGIDLVRSLQQKPMIIFTTAYKKFAYEGFELDAVDYLLKPIDYTRFNKAVQKAIQFYQQAKSAKPAEEACFFVRSEYQQVKINIDSIEFIEGLEDYIKIHIINAKPVLTLMTLKAMQEKLPADKFIRIHRSYIIPLMQIVSIANRKILLASSRELPVSDTYIEKVNELIKKKNW